MATIVRGIDAKGDWVFGDGTQSYKRGVAQVAQRIATHLRSWYRDCFFDLDAGVDWKNLLGQYGTEKDIAKAVRKQIDSIEEVKTIQDISLNLTEERLLILQYSITTIYGTVDEMVELFL